ncbi:MAG: exo-beta-N-acetylmuramidase NamZ family protein [Pseudobdellovibrionaceae bacterium]
MKMGLEVLLEDKKLIQSLKKKRVALICHPASVDEKLRHSFDLLHKAIGLSAAFGPQHGVKGEKQDNMIESEDFIHPEYKIPIFSLYGKVRTPTPKMMETFDVALFDLQDLGCRIYTFITTLLYVMQECAKYKKQIIILDRPNPAGREVEGFSLRPGWESFVGAAEFPMRHGLTCGEMALYYKDHYHLDLDLNIIKMKGYHCEKKPGFGWPQDRAWVNPSPNAQTLNMARAYCGTVMIEGTTLSEGRGTTRALEQVGASDINFAEVLKLMQKKAPQWLKGCILRECFFEPTFHKHEKKLCHGFQIHTDIATYNPKAFKPYRLIALMLKCVRELHPGYPLYRDFAYEYTVGKLAFDVINGGPELREWIENPKSKPADLEKSLKKDEKEWLKLRRKFLLY